MFIIDIWDQLDNKKAKTASLWYIYGLNSEIWKTISDIQITIVEKKFWDFVINFLLNWKTIWSITWWIEEDYVYIDKISNINLNFYRNFARNVNYYTKCLSKELIWKIKIDNLWTNMFINVLLYLLLNKKIKERWITHIKLSPSITSIWFYHKLRKKLLQIWLIKWFDEIKTEIDWEIFNEYFRFYI